MREKRTRIEIVVLSTAAAEWSLLALVFVFFAFADQLSQVVPDTLPTVWFLHYQYEFLVSEGVDAASAALYLQIFNLVIWISIPVFLLRLVTAWYFVFQDLQKARASPFRLIIGLLAMSSAVWGAVDINASTEVSVFKQLLHFSPRAFVCMEAFLFIGGIIGFLEALIILVLLWSNRKTEA